MRRRAHRIPTILVGLFALVATTAAAEQVQSAPQTYTVNSTADVVNTGGESCDTGATVGGNAECTLRAAIQAANAHGNAGQPDTIVVPDLGNDGVADVFALTLAGDNEDAAATGDLDVLEDVVVTGAGSPLTIVDAAGLVPADSTGDRLVHVIDDVDLDLSGVTLRNGAVSGSGGALLVDDEEFNASLTLSDVVATGNSAGGFGGGITALAGHVGLSGVVVDGNSGAVGGGLVVAAESSDSVIVSGGSFSGNEAVLAGGMFLLVGHHTPVTLSDVTADDNLATSGAGGIFILGGGTGNPVTMTDVTADGNTVSGVGFGGIANLTLNDDPSKTSPITMERVSASNNLSVDLDEDGDPITDDDGDVIPVGIVGGILNLTAEHSPVTLTDVTADGNVALGLGGITNLTLNTGVEPESHSSGAVGGSPITLTDVSADGNRAPALVGGILNLSAENSPLTLTRVSADGNDVSSGLIGGMLNVTLNALTHYDGGDGVETASPIVMQDVSTDGNDTIAVGGMLNLSVSNSPITLTDTSADGNVGLTLPGMTNLTLHGSNDGLGSPVALERVSVDGNRAALGEGEDETLGVIAGMLNLTLLDSPLTMLDTTADGNLAEAFGGMTNITLGFDSPMVFERTSADANTTPSGLGGMFNTSVGGIELHDVSTDGNLAEGPTGTLAGALHVAFGDIVMDRVSAVGNVASGPLAAVTTLPVGYEDDTDTFVPGRLLVSDSVVADNVAGGFAAGLVNWLVEGGSASIDSTSITGNVAGEDTSTDADDASEDGGDAGGLLNFVGSVDEPVDVQITDSTIANNLAQAGEEFDGNGAGIWNDGGGVDLTLRNTTLSGNVADGAGGGVYHSDTSFLDDAAGSTDSSALLTAGFEAFGRIQGQATDQVLDLGSDLFEAQTRIFDGLGGLASLDLGVAGLDDLPLDVSLAGIDPVVDGLSARLGGVATRSLTSLNRLDGFDAADALDASVRDAGGGDVRAADGDGATLDIEHATITGNQAATGGGIFGPPAVVLLDGEGPSVNLARSIVADNTATAGPGDCDAAVISGGYNIDGDGTCDLSLETDSDETDPLLDPLADAGGLTATHVPAESSPAVDAIAAEDCPPPGADQRGVARPADGDLDGVQLCDIGAVEVLRADLALAGTDAPDPVRVGNDLTYEWTVTNGSIDAAPARLVSVLPASVTVDDVAPASADPSQGECALAGQTLTCELGLVAPGTPATVSLTVTPNQTGSITTSTTVETGPPGEEIDPSDNSLDLTTSVTSPASAGGVSTCDMSSDSGTCTVAPGGTVSTTGGAVETSVTSPNGGTVTITTSETTEEAPDGFSFLGVQIDIDAPDASPEDPLVITFRVDESELPEGTTAGNLEIFRNGVLVPACNDASSGEADPDPCVQSRTTDDGDAVITILTSQASAWNFGVGLPSACPAGDVPAAGFTDVAATNVHAPAIDCLAWWAISRGATETTYAPARHVTRAQMAAFVARTIEAAGVALPDGGDAFTDDDGNVHETDINRLAAAGIVNGTGGGRYSPTGSISRAQMTTLLVAAYEYVSGTTLTASEDYFTDDDGNFHEANINRAREAGFTAGKTATTFEPAAAVRRDQMASFVVNLLGRFADEGHVSPPAG